MVVVSARPTIERVQIVPDENGDVPAMIAYSANQPSDRWKWMDRLPIVARLMHRPKCCRDSPNRTQSKIASEGLVKVEVNNSRNEDTQKTE